MGGVARGEARRTRKAPRARGLSPLRPSDLKGGRRSSKNKRTRAKPESGSGVGKRSREAESGSGVGKPSRGRSRTAGRGEALRGVSGRKGSRPHSIPGIAFTPSGARCRGAVSREARSRT
jgi:hypothetical protein